MSQTPPQCLTSPVVDTIIKILFVSASNITYLLVSLFILYIGIILYVDGDYLYNKVKDFAISRCKYEIFLSDYSVVKL